MSLADTDAAAAAVAKGPRVSEIDIERSIAFRLDTTGGRIIAHECAGSVPDNAKSLEVLSICLLVTRNGFTVVGKSAPASPENYDRDLGARFAYEDAFRQLWPLMGYALRDRLWRDSYDAMTFSKTLVDHLASTETT